MLELAYFSELASAPSCISQLPILFSASDQASDDFGWRETTLAQGTFCGQLECGWCLCMESRDICGWFM